MVLWIHDSPRDLHGSCFVVADLQPHLSVWFGFEITFDGHMTLPTTMQTVVNFLANERV